MCGDSQKTHVLVRQLCTPRVRYHIHGLWPIRPNQAHADYTKIYLDGISSSYGVTIDDFKVEALPFQCDALIENPSFEQGSAFWGPTDSIDRMRTSIYTPGAGGESDSALIVHDRDDRWRGLLQRLDPRCFNVGDEYVISAKFRMLDATTGEGVSCNKNTQWDTGDNCETDETNGCNCPNVVVYGRSCPGGDIYWQFWNALSGFTWDPASYNEFG